MNFAVNGRWAAMACIVFLALLAGACGEQMIDDFIDQHMHRRHCVNWADEGKIFVLHNGCYGLATNDNYRKSQEYLECTMASNTLEAPWPSTPDADVEVQEYGPAQWREVLPWLERYRWITVNPSFSSTSLAVALASTQLKVMHRRGVVLVYLPQGPDATRVDFSSHRSREHEAERYICGGYRIDHIAFRETLRSLVDEFTTRAVEDGRAPTPLVVSAYSYSGPPTLEVVRKNPHVFFFNVAPNFGWAQWRGREDHEIGGIPDCNPIWPGDSYHEMKFANPRVMQYMYNQAFARVPQCLIASRDDGITVGFRGFAVNMWNAEPARFNDPEEVRPKSELVNYDPTDTRTFWPQDYCANAEPGYRGLKQYTGPDSLAAGGDPFNDVFWEWPRDAAGREQTESCFCMAANLVSNSEKFNLPMGHLLPRAFQANAQTVGTLKIVMARTPARDEDLSYGYALTRNFGENAYYGHTAYWLNGILPSNTDTPVPLEYYTANLNFREVLQECVAQFEPSSSPVVAGAYEWAHGRRHCCRCRGGDIF
jgi:hypothetical protein